MDVLQIAVVGDRLMVTGEIDMSNAETLDAAISKRPDVVCLDLSQVSFIDSSGLHVLARAYRRDATVRVVAGSRVVRRVLEIGGLTYLAAMEPSH